ncbi:MAG TPA: class I SAM-dependent methyltransferase [Chthoniobacteraceae bacterium]|nr:class I SAM-dependent methyltransferase [Chthoniobacteraceae bacterium]
MLRKLLFNTLRAIRPDLLPTERYLETFDFQSGLGDSAWLLHGLARSMKPEVCVEIGSARGKSACYIGLALRRNGKGKLYAIDPHSPTRWNDTQSTDTFAIITENLRKAGVAEQVEIVRETSAQARARITQPIDMLFIDGDHSYEGVKADWDLFAPLVKPFGVVIFHDTIWDLKPDEKIGRADMGVPRFVDELREAGYQTITIDQDFGVTLVQPRIGGVALRPA